MDFKDLVKSELEQEQLCVMELEHSETFRVISNNSLIGTIYFDGPDPMVVGLRRGNQIDMLDFNQNAPGSLDAILEFFKLQQLRLSLGPGLIMDSSPK